MLTVSPIRQWIRINCLSVSTLLLQSLLQLLLLLLAKAKENGMEIPAGVQRLFSHKLSSRRSTTIRVPVSNPLVVIDGENIRVFTPSVTIATGTIAAHATRVVVKGVSRWGMRPKIVGAHGLQIRTSNRNNQLHRTHSSSSHSVETGDVSSVGLKVISNAIALN